MRKSAIMIAFLFSIGMLHAQDNSSVIEKGTVLTLGNVTASSYQHIDFPRKNIIIKRGAIADFNNLEGRKVFVEEIVTANGKTKVTLKRKDGRNFFRFWPTVTSDIEMALAKGELKMPNTKREDSIADNE
ncbi:MAG: hypothetical protein WBM98_14630 [Maribacter sp.]|uniref:hypothetical protein n=1 Tax=Maribacter sp. TaxID=1897614 RepID=UPI003C746B63